MKTLILFFVTSFLFACSSNSPSPSPIQTVGCTLETTVASALSQSIASTLSCSNQSQIQADLLAALGKVNFCASAVMPSASASDPKKAKGILGDVVCPIAINSAMGVLGSKVPASWGCSPAASTNTLTQSLTVVCQSVVSI